jgi:hypothetical protein
MLGTGRSVVETLEVQNDVGGRAGRGAIFRNGRSEKSSLAFPGMERTQ